MQSSMLALLNLLLRTIVASIVTPIAQLQRKYMCRLFIFLLLDFVSANAVAYTRRIRNDWVELATSTGLSLTALIAARDCENIYIFFYFINYLNNDASIAYNMKSIILCMSILSDA